MIDHEALKEVTERSSKILQEKEALNLWDTIDDVMEVVQASRARKWSWARNPFNTKYLNLRVDMRSGHCIIMDSDNKRIDPTQLKYQV